MFFCIDVNYLCKKINTELVFKSKPKPITPLDSCVYTLNNRTPSYISELKIPMSQMWHNPTAIVCMQTANPLTRLRRLV